MTDAQTQKLLLDAYNAAPAAVQNLIKNEGLAAFTTKMQQQFSLSEPAVNQLSNLLLWLVLGGTDAEEFFSDLVDIEDLPAGASVPLFEAVTKEIIEPLDKGIAAAPQKPAAPTQTTPQAAARPLAPMSQAVNKPPVQLVAPKPVSPQMPKPMPQNTPKPDLSIPELPPEPAHMELKAHTMAEDAAAAGGPVSKTVPAAPKMPPPVSKPMSSPLGAALETIQQKQPMNTPKPAVPPPAPPQKPIVPPKPAPLPPQNGKPLDPYREPIE